MIEREFAGEAREFALRYPRHWPASTVGCFETARFGNLSDLAQRAARGTLGDGHVRHVLMHALAGADNPLALMKAHAMVVAEMDGKPLAPYLGIAVAVITDAFAGGE